MPRRDKQKSLGDLINEPTKTNKQSFGRQKLQSRIVDDEGPWVSSPPIQRERSFNRRRWYPILIIACAVCALLAPIMVRSLPPLVPRSMDVRQAQAEPPAVVEGEVAQLFQEGDVGVVLAQIKGGTGDDPFVITNAITAYLTEAGIPYTTIEESIAHYDYDKGVSISNAFDATVVVWGHPSTIVENGIDLYYVVTPRDRWLTEDLHRYDIVTFDDDQGILTVKNANIDYLAQYLTAQVLYHENALEAAHEYIDRLNEYLLGQSPGQLQNLQAGWVYFQSGFIHGELEQYSSSILAYTEALKLNPDFTNAYYNRGYAYNQLGDYEQAIADFDQTIEIVSDDPWTYIYRGSAYQQLGDYEQAIADYAQAIDLDSSIEYAFWGRGSAHYELGNYESAIADYRRYEELNGALEPFMTWYIAEMEAALEEAP